MRLHLSALALLVACAGSKPPGTVPILDGPALVQDGALLSCRLGSPSTPDTGCAALGMLTVRAVSFLPDTGAVRYFGSATPPPAARPPKPRFGGVTAPGGFPAAG